MLYVAYLFAKNLILIKSKFSKIRKKLDGIYNIISKKKRDNKLSLSFSHSNVP